MSLGHRIFVIKGDAVSRMTQETFNNFFFRKQPALRAYAGQTLTLAVPIYEIENRRPVRVVRLDTLRLTVKQDGSLDEGEHLLRIRDSMNAAQRRANQGSPKISPGAYERILADLKILRNS